MGEWREVTIESVAKRIAMGPFGSDIQTDNFVSSGVPVI
jgi:type I restriction enzyme, S subunit